MSGREVNRSSRGAPDHIDVAVADALDEFADDPGAQVVYKDIVGRFGYSGAALFYDGLAARYDSEAGSDYRAAVARAMYSKGIALAAADRPEEAIRAYDDLIASFDDSAESDVRADVARALFNKGRMLDDLGRHDEEFASYDELAERFGGDPDTDVQWEVALGLRNKAHTLWQLDRNDEAVAVCEEVEALIGEAADPRLRETLARTLSLKGYALLERRRDEEALALFGSVVEEYGADPRAPVAAKGRRSACEQSPRPMAPRSIPVGHRCKARTSCALR